MSNHAKSDAKIYIYMLKDIYILNNHETWPAHIICVYLLLYLFLQFIFFLTFLLAKSCLIECLFALLNESRTQGN